MICPECGHDNITGVDYCYECQSDLRDLDIPQPVAGLQSSILTDMVGDIPGSAPTAFGPEASVAEAVTRMRETRHGFVLITKNTALIGIFTEADLLQRLDFNADLGQILLRDVMTPDPHYLGLSDTLSHALNAMAVDQVRHIPLVTSGQPFSLISVRDVLSYMRGKIL